MKVAAHKTQNIIYTQESNNHKMKWFSYQYHKTSDDYGY